MFVKFIRHYKYLEKPFDDWTKLTLEQYDALSCGKVNPAIHNNYSVYLNDKYTKSDFYKYDLIITSNMRRCIETGNTIKDTFKLNIPVIESAYLEEVFWSPKTMISEASFIESQKDNKLNLYDKRLTQFMSGEAPKDISATFKQLRSLESLLLKRQEKNILCVTHSFFLKMLNLYFIDNIKDESKVTLEMLRSLKTQELEINL